MKFKDFAEVLTIEALKFISEMIGLAIAKLIWQDNLGFSGWYKANDIGFVDLND